MVDFKITDGPLRILRWNYGGCRPATDSEIQLWDEIARLQEQVETLRKERDRLREAFEAARYVPGDYPIVPIKIDRFMKTVERILVEKENGR